VLAVQNAPISLDAYIPYLSPATIGLHLKLHNNYVEKVNAHLAKRGLDTHDALSAVKIAERSGDIDFIHAAQQVVNHDFYWSGFHTYAQPESNVYELADAVGDSKAHALITEIAGRGSGIFGSGWVWMVFRRGGIEVDSAPNSELTWMINPATPLLCVDVWEHAYLLDYGSSRDDYLSLILAHVVDWGVVAHRLRLCGRKSA